METCPESTSMVGKRKSSDAKKVLLSSSFRLLIRRSGSLVRRSWSLVRLVYRISLYTQLKFFLSPTNTFNAVFLQFPFSQTSMGLYIIFKVKKFKICTRTDFLYDLCVLKRLSFKIQNDLLFHIKIIVRQCCFGNSWGNYTTKVSPDKSIRYTYM